VESRQLILPDHLRIRLKKPLGRIIKNLGELEFEDRIIITVGDETSAMLVLGGVLPKIVVYDGLTQRKPIEIPPEIEAYEAEDVKIVNPPGCLNPAVFAEITKAVERSGYTRIIVDGEDDLITLAAILRAPLGSIVLYGQPGEGAVVVNVTNEKKQEIESIVKDMENEDGHRDTI